MQYTSFLVLAVAFATCCFAQKNAADAVKSIDSIAQAIADVETLVNGAHAYHGDDRTERELVSWTSEPFQYLPRLLADTGMNKTILKQWRDLVVAAEGDFNRNVSPELKSKATEQEKEQICVSQNKVRLTSLTSSRLSFVSAQGQNADFFTIIVY
jgi:hypothetical protein